MRDSARIVSIPRTSHARLLDPRTAIGLTNSSQLCLPLRCRCRYQLPTSTLSAPSPISHLQAPTVLARSLHGKLDLVIQTSPPPPARSPTASGSPPFAAAPTAGRGA